MKFKISILLFILFLLFSCENHKKIEFPVYTDAEINKVKSFKKEMDYLKLYKKVKIPIDEVGKISHYKLKKNYILFQSYKNGGFIGSLFDLNGRFIGKIGSIGRGPGEYKALTDIVFISKDEFYAIDRGRNIFLKYKIKNKKIKFIDQYNLNFQFYIDRIFYKNGKFYCISFGGPKDSYKVHVMNNNLEIIDRFHRMDKYSEAIVSLIAFNNNRFFFLGPFDFDKKEHYNSTLYIYSLDGKRSNTIDIKEKNPDRIYTDKNGKFIFIKKNSEVKIYDLKGKLINTVESFTDYKSTNYSSKYNNIIYLFKNENKKNLIVKIFKCEI